jgi:hypothetical protein
MGLPPGTTRHRTTAHSILAFNFGEVLETSVTTRFEMMKSLCVYPLGKHNFSNFSWVLHPHFRSWVYPRLSKWVVVLVAYTQPIPSERHLTRKGCMSLDDGNEPWSRQSRNLSSCSSPLRGRIEQTLLDLVWKFYTTPLNSACVGSFLRSVDRPLFGEGWVADWTC